MFLCTYFPFNFKSQLFDSNVVIIYFGNNLFSVWPLQYQLNTVNWKVFCESLFVLKDTSVTFLNTLCLFWHRRILLKSMAEMTQKWDLKSKSIEILPLSLMLKSHSNILKVILLTTVSITLLNLRVASI